MNDASGQIVPAEKALATVEDVLRKNAKRLAEALPRHIEPARFMRLVMSSIRRDRKLAACTISSLLSAMMEATTLGLEIGTGVGHCWILPFRNHGVLECHLLLGYKGLVELAYRSNKIALLRAAEVYEGDDFSYRYGTEPFLHHKHTPDTNWNIITHAYCMSRVREGDLTFEVMEKAEIEAVRSRSRATDGPWQTDPGMMSRKSVVKRTCKMLPCSAELGRALALDNDAEAGVSQVFEREFNLDEAPPAKPLPAPAPSPSPPRSRIVVVKDGKTTDVTPGVERVIEEPPVGEPPPDVGQTVIPGAEPAPEAQVAPADPSSSVISAAASRELYGRLRALASSSGITGTPERLTKVVKQYVLDAYGRAVDRLTEVEADEALTRGDAAEMMLAAGMKVG